MRLWSQVYERLSQEDHLSLRSRLQLTVSVPLHSSLGYRARLCFWGEKTKREDFEIQKKKIWKVQKNVKEES